MIETEGKGDVVSQAQEDPLTSKDKGQDEIQGVEKEKPVLGEAWRNKREYFLALTGLIIGFGNVWRFPYLIHKNGGAAFLIPLTFFTLFAGIPLFFMEVAIGQRMRKGAIGTLNSISPYLTGLGISAGFICGLVALYYNALIGWCISYFVWSWTFPKLPWTSCKNHRRTDQFLIYESINKSLGHFLKNVTEVKPNQECELAGPAQYFWFRETLDVSSDITENGNWNWWIFLWQILAWVIVCLCLTWGTNSMGKVSYITGFLPFVVIFIFLVRGFFLEDFSEGLRILFAPDWGKLLKGKVWLDAGAQIFFGLGLGWGIVITFASYSPIQNTCHRDSFYIPLLSFLVSIFATSVLFMILGYKGMKDYRRCCQNRNDTIHALLDIKGLLAKNFSEDWGLKSLNFPHDHFISSLNVTLKNKNGSELIANVWGSPENRDDKIYAKFCDKESIIRATGSGTGLIFITFAEAVTSFPASQLWSILFMIMMLALGIGSQNGIMEGIMSCLADLKLFKVQKWKIVLVTCTGFMTVGVCIFSSGNGMYILTLFDEMIVGWVVLTISLLQVIFVSYFYGLERFSYEIKLMTGYRPNALLLLCWKFISPLLILIILISSAIFSITEGATYQRWRSDLGMNDNTHWGSGYIAIASILVLLILGSFTLIVILTYFGFRILKEPQAEFPEQILKDLRNYNPEEDEKSISRLQRALMASNFKDMRSALRDRNRTRSRELSIINKLM